MITQQTLNTTMITHMGDGEVFRRPWPDLGRAGQASRHRHVLRPEAVSFN